jgi:hypothetical protein
MTNRKRFTIVNLPFTPGALADYARKNWGVDYQSDDRVLVIDVSPGNYFALAFDPGVPQLTKIIEFDVRKPNAPRS